MMSNAGSGNQQDQTLRDAFQDGTSDDDRNFLYGLPASIHDAPTRRFFGRSKEIEELHSALRNPDIYRCCIFGLPGVGKSRLAIEFAHEVRSLNGDWHILYIDTQELTRNSVLENKIHRIVLQDWNPIAVSGFANEEVQRELFAQAVRRVSKLLLVLDGCDRILASHHEHQLFVSMLHKMVTAGRRDFTIVTTSCMQYGLCCKEQLKLRVEPLDEEPAVEFLECWCPNFAERPEPAEVKELSKTCGGLPRYLEAVGAVLENYVRVGIIGAAELLESMKKDPIKTLDGYLQYSKPSTGFWELFQIMPEDLKKAFWCLSLLQGKFSKEDGADVLCIDEGTIACVLTRLFDLAMVVIHPNGEYSQHHLIREFALQEAKMANCAQFNKSQQRFSKAPV